MLLSRTILHKRGNDCGDSNHKQRCHPVPTLCRPLPMPVSRNELRSEKNACCPPRCILESPAGSLGRAHQSHKMPYCLRSSRRVLCSGLPSESLASHVALTRQELLSTIEPF